MTVRVPFVRRVDMLTGAKAPTAFFKALSEADEFCKESADIDTLRDQRDELQTRVYELIAERNEWRARALAACPHGCES